MAEEIITKKDRLWGVMAYLWVFTFIPYVLQPKNKFIRYHAKQGMVLFIAEIILTLIWAVPYLGWLIGFFGYFFCLLFSLKGIVSVLSGQYWRMPWLGRWTEKIKI